MRLAPALVAGRAAAGAKPSSSISDVEPTSASRAASVATPACASSASPAVACRLAPATSVGPTAVRIYLGTLDFQGGSALGGFGLSGLFETAGFRIQVHLGAQPHKRWLDDGPATHKQVLKYGRVVTNEGRYGSRICCEFDEAFDLPWPGELRPEQVVADIWLERRTVVEQLDSILDSVGLGNDLPDFERIWAGRAVASLPAQGEDALPRAWPVAADSSLSGPLPRALSVGVEWVAEPDGG